MLSMILCLLLDGLHACNFPLGMLLGFCAGMMYMYLGTNLLSYAGNIKFPPRCIVQYCGHEHKIQAKPCGNSKHRKQSLCRTLPSTIIAL